MNYFIMTILAALTASAVAYKPVNQNRAVQSLYAKNRFPYDERRNSFASPEMADIGWGPLGSLIRQGLVPFVIRVVKPDTYEAAVLSQYPQ